MCMPTGKDKINAQGNVDQGASLAGSGSLRTRTQCACKRAVDVFGSASFLIILSPVFVVVALLVKLQDAGPVLHRRRVVGARGEFDAFKFRTMRVDADEILKNDVKLRRAFEQSFKLEDDPRVTPIGRLLRKFSIDELPQLINVLKGEMSLVGPRMITAPELSKYGEFQSLLLTVKPGLSGYWQVNGRQTVSYGTRVQMDVFYIRHWSLLLDFSILIKTPLAVLRKQGAF
jgi:lipopolysaccharide/colanic/teichoic acid biosynthesis glycosyltransferase